MRFARWTHSAGAGEGANDELSSPVDHDVESVATVEQEGGERRVAVRTERPIAAELATLRQGADFATEEAGGPGRQRGARGPHGRG